MKNWLREYHPNVVRILQFIRYELRSGAIHIAGKLSPRQRATIRRLRQSRGIKLNIAGGRTSFADWINIDVLPSADIRMDVRRPLPLRTGSVALIFSEHFLDYVNFPQEIGRLLAEFFRVLEPGGRLRVILQDGPATMQAYFDRDTRFRDHPDQTMMEAVNLLFRSHDFRHFLYDYETFEKLLRKAGFSQVLRCHYRQSECPEIALDHDQPVRQIMSMYIEAVK